MAIDDDFERDAIEGLIEYVEEIKPYHSKIVEVLVEYIYTDELNVTIDDRLDSSINVRIHDFAPGCSDGYDTGGYDLLAGNELPGDDIQSIDLGNNSVLLIEEDLTDKYVPGKLVEIVDSTDNNGSYIVDYSTFDGTDTMVFLASPALTSNTSDGQIVAYVDGNQDIPLSNYDLSVDPSCDASALGSPVGGDFTTTFVEDLSIELVPVDLLGAEYNVTTFDEIDGNGYDI